MPAIAELRKLYADADHDLGKGNPTDAVFAILYSVPALLAVAEAAEEAVGWMDDLLRTDEIGGDGPYCCREELTAALKRLEEER